MLVVRSATQYPYRLIERDSVRPPGSITDIHHSEIGKTQKISPNFPEMFEKWIPQNVT